MRRTKVHTYVEELKLYVYNNILRKHRLGKLSPLGLVHSIMVGFLDIPLELLPVIFDSVVRPQHLASLCLVNKSFNEFAIPSLYQRVYIYAWHKEVKSKVDIAMFI